jgi:hypothetical protein
MINVSYKKCIEKECCENAYYNYKDCESPIYCTKHSKEGMKNLIIKLCSVKDCNKVPSFGYLENNNNLMYCLDHKKEDMVDIKHKTCIIENCSSRAVYNYSNSTKAEYCYTHKNKEMIDFSHQLCKTNLCYTRVNDKYEGYCLNCFIHIFPDKPVTRNYKTKENEIKEFILKSFPDRTWICDKKIQDGCSRRRPDILLDLGYQTIIIEVDENQHIDYDTSCEKKRINEIYSDLGDRPIVLIRFNPDEYIIKNEKKLSCWGVNKIGIYTIKKTYQKEWSNRLEKLKNTITFWLNPTNIVNDMVEIVYLFYDEE